MGVTVLYLNPIFFAPSNHKYDTIDFMQIDPRFGDLATFQSLAAQADALCIKIVLDGVFNHASSDSIYFDRYSRWDSLGDPTTIGANDASGKSEIANRTATVDYGVTGTQTVSDTVADWKDPFIVAFTPADGTNNIASNAVITFTWNQEMPASLAGTVSIKDSSNADVAGTLGYDNGTFTHTFTPTSLLAVDTYTVAISGNTDVNGDGQQVASTWSFSVPSYALLLTPDSDTVIEGNSVTYDVALSLPPVDDVTVTLSTASTEVIVSPTTLTFDTTNWGTAQTITLDVADNALVDGTRIAEILHEIASTGDADYDALADVNYTLTINDDDAPVITPPTGGGDDDTSGGDTGENPANSPPAWDIQISIDTDFFTPGMRVTFTITIRKLIGGTPVQVDFPMPSGFKLIDMSSNHGAVAMNGQTVVYTDDIHVGEVGIVTVVAEVGQNAQTSGQACINVPVTKCSTWQLAQVTQLPSTGETPLWRNLLLEAIVLVVGFAITFGVWRMRRQHR